MHYKYLHWWHCPFASVFHLCWYLQIVHIRVMPHVSTFNNCMAYCNGLVLLPYHVSQGLGRIVGITPAFTPEKLTIFCPILLIFRDLITLPYAVKPAQCPNRGPSAPRWLQCTLWSRTSSSTTQLSFLCPLTCGLVKGASPTWSSLAMRSNITCSPMDS